MREDVKVTCHEFLIRCTISLILYRRGSRDVSVDCDQQPRLVRFGKRLGAS